MIVRKQFAPDYGDLNASMEQLIEVLVQLLAESGSDSDLRSGLDRAIHVSGNEQN